MQPETTPQRDAPPRGWTAMGIFLFFGSAMATFAGATLIWRGTPLDHLWVLNARAYVELSAFERWIGVPLLLLAIALLVAGIGWFRRHRWGWRLTVAIFAIQVGGDLVNAFRGDVLQGATGAAIAAVLLIWLVQARVKRAFDTERNAWNEDPLKSR